MTLLAIFTAGIQGKWDICKSSCASTSRKASHTSTAAGGGCRMMCMSLSSS